MGSAPRASVSSTITRSRWVRVLPSELLRGAAGAAPCRPRRGKSSQVARGPTVVRDRGGAVYHRPAHSGELDTPPSLFATGCSAALGLRGVVVHMARPLPVVRYAVELYIYSVYLTGRGIYTARFLPVRSAMHTRARAHVQCVPYREE